MKLNLATIKSTFEASKAADDNGMLASWAMYYGPMLIEKVEGFDKVLRLSRNSQNRENINFNRARDIIKNLARQYETNQWPENEIETAKQIVFASKLMEEKPND